MRSDRSSTAVVVTGGIAHTFAHLFVLLYATAVLVIEREWQGEYGMTYDQLTELWIAGAVMFGLAALPAGWLADRWSVNGMMAVYFFGLGAASVLTGLAPSPTLLLLGLALIGTFAAIYHPVGIPWLIGNVANAGRALGVNGVFGIVGTASAPLVAAALGAALGWRAVFIVPGIVCFLTGFAFLWLWRSGYLDAVARARPSPPPTGRAAADMRRVFAVLAVTVCCSGLIYQATSYALPKVFDERLGGWLGDSLLGVGGMVTLCYATGGLTQLIGGELADRFNLKLIYVCCQLVQIPLYVLGFALIGPALIPVAALMVGMNVMGQPAENSLLARHTPEAWRGKVFGVKFVLTLGVSAGGIAVIPLIYRSYGNMDALFVMLAGAAALSFLAASLLPGRGPLRVQAAPVAQPAGGDD